MKSVAFVEIKVKVKRMAILERMLLMSTKTASIVERRETIEKDTDIGFEAD